MNSIGIHTFHSQDFSSSSSNEKWLHLRGRHSKELEIQTKSIIIPISDDTSSPDDASSPSSGILTIHLSQIKNFIDQLHPKKGGEVSCVYEIYLHSKEVKARREKSNKGSSNKQNLFLKVLFGITKS